MAKIYPGEIYGDCQKCGAKGEVRYSLGLYAGIYCDEHWETSGYRKEGQEGHNYLDAGEYYDEEDY